MQIDSVAIIGDPPFPTKWQSRIKKEPDMPDFGIHIGHGGMLPQEALFAARRKGVRDVALLLPYMAGIPQKGIDVTEKLLKAFALFCDMRVIIGVRMDHIPPQLYEGSVSSLRDAGVSLVVAKGEGLCEGSGTGTNLAAIAAGVDILSDAGLVDEECCRYAHEKGVLFAISGNGDKSFANAHIAEMARRFGIGLVFSSDAHNPSEIRTREEQVLIARGSLLNNTQLAELRSIQTYLQFNM